jgi:DNA-binding transcriptional MerR regulator
MNGYCEHMTRKEEQRRELIARWAQRDLYAELEEMKAALESAENDLETAQEECDADSNAQIETLKNALWEIRDWFDAVLIRREPMRDPRKVLALVERELGL